ncbi:hypothetical protein HXZ66_06130 [Bacillus sp. A116_S68]|nr:hypothetical protein HXZ66_06130 [Bacillus sp. A116_S68]
MTSMNFLIDQLRHHDKNVLLSKSNPYDKVENEILGLNSFVMYGYDEVREDFESVEVYTLKQGFIDEMSKDELLSNAPIGTMVWLAMCVI